MTDPVPARWAVAAGRLDGLRSTGLAQGKSVIKSLIQVNTETSGFFFHSPLLKFGPFQIFKGGFCIVSDRRDAIVIACTVTKGYFPK